VVVIRNRAMILICACLLVIPAIGDISVKTSASSIGDNNSNDENITKKETSLVTDDEELYSINRPSNYKDHLNNTNDTTYYTSPPNKDGIYEITYEEIMKRENESKSSSLIEQGMSIDSFNPPQMEILADVYTPHSENVDGWTNIFIDVRFQDETDAHTIHELGYVGFEMRQTVYPFTLYCNGYTDPNGTRWCHIGVPWSSYLTFNLKVWMDDGRGNDEACGVVRDGNNNTFWGVSGTYDFWDTRWYNLILTFGDSGDGGQSYVGAAGIYNCIQKSKAFIRNYDSDPINDIVLWASYDNDQWAGVYYHVEYVHWIKLQSYLFSDDYQENWDNGTEVAFHEYGHAVMHQCAHIDLHTDNPHSKFEEHSTEESAFEEGWAQAFACIVPNNDFFNTLVPNQTYPNNQLHLETFTFNTYSYTAQYHSSPTIHGEKLELCVASILWDIADASTSTDVTPNFDEDSLNGEFAKLWAVLHTDIDDAQITSIRIFWDRWQMTYLSLCDSLGAIYLKSNVGRYKYYDYGAGPSSTVQNLQMSHWEIWGMNPSLVPGESVLVRYRLYHDNTGTLQFWNEFGMLVVARDKNNNGCDFGWSFVNGILAAHEYIVFTNITTVTVDYGSYSFWPYFCLNINNQRVDGGWESLKQSVGCYAQIFFEGFEGNPQWTGNRYDENPGCDRDYWDVTTHRYHNGSRSTWCAETGSHTSSYYYDDSMEAYFEFSGNFRYTKVMVSFDYYQKVENGKDYLIIETYDRHSDIWVAQTSYQSNTTDWSNVIYTFSSASWYSFTSGDPPSMLIRFYFHSDNKNHAWNGTYLDDIYFFGG
jgi:hypothetical protein